MSLFRHKQSARERFTPKEIKLSSVYKTNTNTNNKLTNTILDKANKALLKAGFTEEKISSVLYKDAAVPILEMKKITEVMNQAKIYGFTKNPKYAIEKYLNKERVKAQSIANIRKEHILEAGSEDLTKFSATSLSQKGVSPNAPKAGESSILFRRQKTSALSSLSGKESSRPSSSLNRPGDSKISINKATGSGGLSLRPRF